MDADLTALPDDIAALKAALAIERARVREVVAERDAGAAELAVARAKASEDLALIAHQKLRIAQLERRIYGPRSERLERLIDQLALQFEELAAGVAEDEGVPISLSTMADSVGSSCAALEPLLRRIEAHVLAAKRRHGDDTTVPVLARG